ncbi:hypothetical protein OnM2_056016 [Erysiphe neolycopersici]|uniref:Reverse transcriptase Ty1/copia-type domain-containing protein n=1 Tax=Erysiphe neolycopersici TaxID=212602 RepID=A0A420HR02_9PEZI|nr:hypothetical protein OnM2_056016 [Erysiphe neolycopersici]
MTSLVSLQLMNVKGVHWNSMAPLKIVRTPIEKIELLSNTPHSKSAFIETNDKVKNKIVRHKVFDKVKLHRIFGHPSPEVVNHIADAARKGSITVLDTVPAPESLKCETCALSEAHQLISKTSEKEHPQTKPFERINVDLIPMREGYNSNTQIIHFQCAKTLFNMIFTMYTKSESLTFTKKTLELVKSMSYRGLDDLAAEEEITEQEAVQALEWPSIIENNSLEIEEDSVDELDTVIPMQPQIFISDDNTNSLPQKIDDKNFRLPGIFPDELQLHASPQRTAKGYTYIDDLKSRAPSPHAMDGTRELAKARGNQARNAALINPEIDSQNILSKRTRNSNKTSQFVQYHSSFSSAIMKTKPWTKLTREELPPEPKGWDQMLRHQFSTEFQKAAEKEYNSLESKETWEYKEKEKVPYTCKIIPVIWIFTYKFDSNGYLRKFKARICARGDLLEYEDDPYAATLASQSFRAMMAITAAHDLEIRQYDIVNAFVNAPIRGEVYCYSPKGFVKKRR